MLARISFSYYYDCDFKCLELWKTGISILLCVLPLSSSIHFFNFIKYKLLGSPIGTDWLTQIATCLQSVCIYKLNSNYLPSPICLRVIAVSPCQASITWRQFVSNQVTCLIALWSKMDIQRLRLLPSQPLGNQLVAASTCNQSSGAKIKCTDFS